MQMKRKASGSLWYISVHAFTPIKLSTSKTPLSITKKSLVINAAYVRSIHFNFVPLIPCQATDQKWKGVNPYILFFTFIFFFLTTVSFYISLVWQACLFESPSVLLVRSLLTTQTLLLAVLWDWFMILTETASRNGGETNIHCSALPPEWARENLCRAKSI